MRIGFWFVFVICSLLAPQRGYADVTIDAIRFGQHPDRIRMVVDLNRKTEFESFVLPTQDNKPYRIVIDFRDFDWKAGTIPNTANFYVTDIRTGNVRNGPKRVVFDLAKPPLLKNVFMMDGKAGEAARLVLDYRIVSEQVFQDSPRRSFGGLELNSKPALQKAGDPLSLTGLIEKIGSSAPSPPPIKTVPATLSGKAPPHPSQKPPRPDKPKTPLRKKIIVIDAGHGGQDPGAIGAGRLKEKDITLAGAQELKRQLEKTGRYTVHLTRNNDRYIKLHHRVMIARNKEADLFISLHADSINKPNVRGASVYTLSNKASDAQTAKLAARENQSDVIAGVDLTHEDKEVANILLDLAMRDTMNQSKFLANTVVDTMRTHNIRIVNRPHRYAGFAVLKAPDVPSILFEMGFMSNSSESRLLNTPQYRQRIANALVQSIENYFQRIDKNNQK